MSLPDDTAIAQFRNQLLDRLDKEIRPRLYVYVDEGGFDCCGCSTLDDLFEEVFELIKWA